MAADSAMPPAPSTPNAYPARVGDYGASAMITRMNVSPTIGNESNPSRRCVDTTCTAEGNLMKRLSGTSLLAMTIMAASGCALETAEDLGAGGKAINASDDPGFLEPMGLVESPTIATPCTQPSDCPSGFCVDGVCCNNACDGLCRACSNAKKRGGADGTCGNISYGFDPDNECAATCNGLGGCVKTSILLGIGNTCTVNTDCSTGFCVDGYCCDSACTGTCQACSAAKKGSGSNGTCGNIAATTDPDNECAAGDCNGSGACGTATGTDPNGAPCSSGSTCSSGFCVDGVCCNSTCTATCQACTAAKKGGGPDGVCSNIAGGTDPDNECSFANCNGVGACGPIVRYGNGTPCTSSNECSSGYCTDGVCCNDSCTGTCLQCNAAGRLGSCSFVPNGQTDTNSSTPCTGTCNGAGWCFDNTGGNCTAGSECASHICNDLICEGARPANGPLMWLTLRDGAVIAQGNNEGGPLLNLEQISSKLTPGSDIMVNGVVTRIISGAIPSLRYDKLTGGFSAAGTPLLTAWDGSYGTMNFGTFLRSIYRGGTETSYQRPYGSIALAQGCWPINRCAQYGWAHIAAGKNDNGQHGALVALNTIPWGWDDGFDVGDGVMNHEDVLVRYSSAGAIELKVPPPTNLHDPIVLGPAGEFHSMYLDASFVEIVKYDAMAVLAWTKSVTTTGAIRAISSLGADVDAMGNILMAFDFSGSIDFGGGPMVASGTELGLVKLDPSGNVVWQKHFPGEVSNVQLVRAGSQDFAILIQRTGAMDLGTGPITGSFVLAKFDSAGNALWHANLNGLGVATLTADLAGSVYVGSSSKDADYGWGPPLAYKTLAISMAKYGTCTGSGGCRLKNAACSVDTECSSGACVSGACL